MKDEIKEILDSLTIISKLKKTEGIEEICKELNQDEIKILLDYITNLQEEKEKYKKRCYLAHKMIFDNYGVLDKYGIDMLDDILQGEGKQC